MLDYSRALLSKTQKDLEKALTIFQLGTQILYIAYLFYLLFTPNDIWYLHLSLLIVSVAFFVFDIVSRNGIKSIKSSRFSFAKKLHYKQKLARAKKQRNNVRKIKFYTAHVIKLFVLTSMFYPIVVAPETVHPLSIMCTTVMVLLWFLQIIFEVLRFVLEGRGELFMEALHADVEFVTKPVSAVKDTFNKILGKDVEEKPEPTKARLYLDDLVQSTKEEKSEKKAEAKASKTEKFSSWLDKHFSKSNSKSKENDDAIEATYEIKDTEEV